MQQECLRRICKDPERLLERDACTVQAFQKQKAIGEEIRAVRRLSKRFVEQTQRWGGAVRKCDAALRELGDFQNYLGVIDQEMEELAGLIERAAERRAQEAAQSPRR